MAKTQGNTGNTSEKPIEKLQKENFPLRELYKEALLEIENLNERLNK
ncbi:MAG: hypothetical protein JNM41_03910 [Flavipsychrobacter sp.]|nr:hypothetical protein [Flavipsychrobacter sp.]